MTNKEIETLITKYLDGETTIEEEKLLGWEIMRNDTPHEWRIIAAMIGILAIDEFVFDYIMEIRNKGIHHSTNFTCLKNM